MKRLYNILDALSQLLQVILFPRPEDTNANESMSGRSFREGFFSQKVIDRIFFWQKDHCKQAYLKDVERAKSLIEQDLR